MLRFLRRLILGAGIAAVVFIGVAIGAFMTAGLPDPVAAVQKPLIMAKLRARPTRSELSDYLTLIHAQWHDGAGFTAGEAYGGFSMQSPCPGCDSLQIAFTDLYAMCIVRGEVLTVRFDRSARVSSWEAFRSVDGC